MSWLMDLMSALPLCHLVSHPRHPVGGVLRDHYLPATTSLTANDQELAHLPVELNRAGLTSPRGSSFDQCSLLPFFRRRAGLIFKAATHKKEFEPNGRWIL
ncbi:MAG: hypothetical protein II007_09220 [Gammaproteobacteria bacterium]|nr:hypothetical protein [Gammaproteobacteria bacterium]